MTGNRKQTLLWGSLAMAIVVVASNILVQHPIGNWLTWGAFTYPFAFLINDLSNRLAGPKTARRVVLTGFLIGLVCSFIGTQIVGEFGPLVTLRIAIASGTAFLVAHLLDISIFDSQRNKGRWWRAPAVSSLIGSSIDTALFFTIAFAGFLTFIEPGNDVSWATESIPLLGFGPAVPLWVSLAVADFGVKLLLTLISLIPFRVISLRFTTA